MLCHLITQPLDWFGSNFVLEDLACPPRLFYVKRAPNFSIYESKVQGQQQTERHNYYAMRTFPNLLFLMFDLSLFALITRS
jgi:hypothetical protein